MSIELYLRQFRQRGRRRLCSLFQAAAFDTWERMAFSRMTPGLKIHETTVTQNLVYEMNLIKWQLGIPELHLYESTNEKTNGNDLEITIRQAEGWVTYWLQSKILYHLGSRKNVRRLHDGVYRQLHHSTGGKAQIDLLLRRAERSGAVPLYLLYNFVNKRMRMAKYCGLNMDESQFGCSLIGAHLLKKRFSGPTGNLRRNVRFSTLHPSYALPWLVLACCVPRYSIARTKEVFDLPEDYVISAPSESPIYYQPQWRSLIEYPSGTQDFRYSQEDVTGFSPRYRFVIDLDQT